MEVEKEFIWTDEKIFEFIQLRKKYAALFTGRKGTLPAAYGKVAAELGFTGPYTSLKKRWENLCEKYKKCKYPRSGLGTEGGDKGPLSWKFYVPMDEVLGSRHNVAPVFILDSGHDAHQEQAMMLTCSSHPEGSSHLAASSSSSLTQTPSSSNGGLRFGGTPHPRKRSREEGTEELIEYFKKSDEKWLSQMKELMMAHKDISIKLGELLNKE